MGWTLNSGYEWGSYVSYQQTWYCNGNQSFSRNTFYPTTTFEKAVYTADYRKRPTPLWYYPTSYPYVWDEKTKSGTYGGADPGPYVSCDGKYVQSTVHNNSPFNHVGSSPLITDHLTCNWQLPLRLKIKDNLVNLSGSLAEFDKTIDSLIDLSKGINGIYHWARKRTNRQLRALGFKPKRHKFSLSDVSAAQLRASFELGPLISDVSDTYIALQRAVMAGVWKRSVVRVEERSSDKYYITGPLYTTRTGRKSQRAIVYYKLNVNTPITVGNPLEWLWERIPGSFIVDWMFNIGDIVTSLDALNGVDELVGTLTTKTWDTSDIEAGQDYPGGYTVKTPNTLTKNGFGREVLTKNSIPQSSFIPSYQPSTSIRSLANAFALLHQSRVNASIIKRF